MVEQPLRATPRSIKGNGNRARIRAAFRDEPLFYTLNAVLLGIFGLAVLYPLIFVVSASFSNPEALIAGRVWLLPVEPSLQGYQTVFQYDKVWTGFANSVFYTVFGTAINIIMTVIAGYVLSRRDFVGRTVITFLFVFTMLFFPGLIPTYMLVRSLGLIDTRLALLLPWAINVFNLIITRTFFETTIPQSLYDSARVDGASNTRTLISIVVPLSGPILAVITLFYGAYHWNVYFNALVYLRSGDLEPLQLVLREILIVNSPRMVDEMMASLSEGELEAMQERQLLQELLQYSLIVIASVPMLAIYPFAQKYFVRGVMVGSIKG
jgi:multiple sugar transport system permease protein/putative aldouronate transport system permease protein